MSVQTVRRDLALDLAHRLPEASPIARFRPNELRRLCRLRYGRVLPADDQGRRIALRMLDALALAGDASRQQAENFLAVWCQWLDQNGRDEAIEEAFERPRHWSSAALGDDLRLTWAEREAARITTFRPAGVTDDDMAQRRKEKDLERKRERRRTMTMHPAQQPSAPALRAAAIATMLQHGERCTVAALCSEIVRLKNGRFSHLRGKALSTAVHRAIDHGVTAGLLQKAVEPGRKLPTTWVSKSANVR